MPTRRSIIISSYLKLSKELKQNYKFQFFPDFDSVIDIVFFITYTFPNENNYVQTIDDILELDHIELDDKTFSTVCDLIIDFIDLVKSL